MQGLPMLLVLDLTGGLALYSGPQLVSRVFLPGIPAPQAPISLSSHSLLSASSASSPLSSHSDSSFKLKSVQWLRCDSFLVYCNLIILLKERDTKLEYTGSLESYSQCLKINLYLIKQLHLKIPNA